MGLLVNLNLIELTEKQIVDVAEERFGTLYATLDDQIEKLIGSLPKDELLNTLNKEYDALTAHREEVYLGTSKDFKDSVARFSAEFRALAEFPDSEFAQLAPNNLIKEQIADYKGNMDKHLEEAREKQPKTWNEEQIEEIFFLEKKILAFEYMTNFVKNTQFQKKPDSNAYRVIFSNYETGFIFGYDIATRIMKEIGISYPKIDNFQEDQNYIIDLLEFRSMSSGYDGNAILEVNSNSLGLLVHYSPEKYKAQVESILKEINPLIEKVKLYRKVLQFEEQE